MQATTLLLTGATGYIGGTVLSLLLASSHPAIKNLSTISLLVRGEERAEMLRALDPRIVTILFESLGEHEVLMKAGSEHDVVIHTSSGFDLPSAHALLDGLAHRKKAGKIAVYIHTTGISNLADRILSSPPGAGYTPPIYTDAPTDVYQDSIQSTILRLQANQAYPQRTTDLLVSSLSAAYDVPAYLVMPPLIVGQGLGLFNKGSVAVPSLVRAALKLGKVPYLGSGEGVWSGVHIEDLGAAYVRLLEAVLEGREEVVGSGKGMGRGDGYFFVESFYTSWKGLAEDVAGVLEGMGRGVRGVKSVEIEEGAELLAYGMRQFVQGSFGCNSRQRAQRLRELGWEPQFKTGDGSWEETMRGDVKAVLGSGGDTGVKGLVGMGM